MKRSEIDSRGTLQDTVLSSLEPEASEYRVLDGDGLYFRVRPDGNKSWQLRYKKPDGKWSWIGLGGYGKGDHQLTGKQAREAARKLRAEGLANNSSNLLATKRAKAAAEADAANNTFEKLAREWCASKRSAWTDGTASRVLGALEGRCEYPWRWGRSG